MTPKPVLLKRNDWATDERFQTLLGLAEHGPEIVPEIEALFASEPLEHWRERLDAAGLIWEPVAELLEVIEDPALRDAGAFTSGGKLSLMNSDRLRRRPRPAGCGVGSTGGPHLYRL